MRKTQTQPLKCPIWSDDAQLTPALAGGARENLRDTLERLVAHHRSALKRPLPATDQPISETAQSGPIPTVRLSDHLRYGAAARQERHQQRLALFEQMQQAAAHGLTRAEIARQLGVSPNTVRSYLVHGGPPAEICTRPQRAKKIDPYLPHLTQRWQAGCHNASQLWREITELGFHGPRSRVARWVRERRETPAPTTAPRFRAAFQASSKPTASRTAASSELPSNRTLAWLMVKAPDALTSAERTQLEQLIHVDPLQLSYGLAQALQALVRKRKPDELEPWLQRASQTRLRDWQQFATGIRQDLTATLAALSSPWSNGQTEGQVTKLKFYKRQMRRAGRAKLDLLRARMLHAT